MNPAALPPFYCPIEPAIHPKVDEIENCAIAWLDDFPTYDSADRRDWLLGTNAAEFYARIVPYAPEARLQPAVNWVYWAFDFDDSRCDGAETGSNTSDFVDMAARLLVVLDGRRAASELRDPYEVALADIAADFRRLVTPTQLRRWIQAQRNWLFGVAWGVSKTESDATPNLRDYLAQRLNCCGGEPTTAMIEMTNGAEIPSTELDSPRVLALTEATRMVAALDNDLVSYRKELRRREKVRNIISVVAAEDRCSTQDAIVRSMAIRDRLMTLVLRLRERVSSGASYELRTYIESLGHTIRGNLDWSHQVPRYNDDARNRSRTSASTAPVDWADRPSDDNRDPLPVPAIAWWWEQVT